MSPPENQLQVHTQSIIDCIMEFRFIDESRSPKIAGTENINVLISIVSNYFKSYASPEDKKQLFKKLMPLLEMVTKQVSGLTKDTIDMIFGQFNQDIMIEYPDINEPVIRTLSATEKREIIFQSLLEKEKSNSNFDVSQIVLTDAINNFEFETIFRQLSLLDDKAHGINARFITLGNFHDVYYRDASDQSQNLELQNDDYPERWNWAIIGFNYLDAYKSLLNINELESDTNEFKHLVSGYWQTVQDKNIDPKEAVAALIHNHLKPNLAEKLGTEQGDALKQMEIAKDFSNLGFEPFTVATKVKNKNHHSLHIDVPIYEMTSSQKADFTQIQSNFEKEGELPLWFNALPQLAQNLIYNQLDNILEGRVIPTQLRKYLPGLRNMGEDRVFMYDGSSEPVEVYRGFHMGNLGHILPEDNQQLTDKAAEQLSYVTNSARISAVSLTSPAFFRGEENKLENQTIAAMQNLQGAKGLSTNLPLNFLRGVFSNRRDAVKVLIKDCDEIIFKYIENPFGDENKLWRELATSFPQGLSRQEARNFLSNISHNTEDSNLIEMIQLRVEVERVRSGSTFFDSSNKNLQLINKAAQLENKLNAYYNHVDNRVKKAKKMLDIFINEHQDIKSIHAEDIKEYIIKHLKDDPRQSVLITACNLFLLEHREFKNPEDYYALVRSDNPQTIQQFDNINIASTVRFCKSGKDREGLDRLTTISDAIRHFTFKQSSPIRVNPIKTPGFWAKMVAGIIFAPLLFIPTIIAAVSCVQQISRYNKAKAQQQDYIKDILQPVVDARALQKGAGSLGGTLGAVGIKNDSKAALSSELAGVEQSLFLDTAKCNKKAPKNNISADVSGQLAGNIKDHIAEEIQVNPSLGKLGSNRKEEPHVTNHEILKKDDELCDDNITPDYYDESAYSDDEDKGFRYN